MSTEADTPDSTLRRSEEDEETRPRRKKKRKKREMGSIIIYRSEAELQQDDAEEGSASAVDGNLNAPPDDADWENPSDGRLVTLTGTITRGKRKGELVDIHVTLSDRQLRDMARSKERLDAECERSEERQGCWRERQCTLGADVGPHVLLWSLWCSPFVFLLSFVTAFYYATLTWYNVFLVFNEERTFLHKVLVCPLLVLGYPLLTVPPCVAVATYAAADQLSWSFGGWRQAVGDLEKGACGWACGKLGLEDCAPYSVVELLDSDTTLCDTLQRARVREEEGEHPEQTSTM